MSGGVALGYLEGYGLGPGGKQHRQQKAYDCNALFHKSKDSIISPMLFLPCQNWERGNAALIFIKKRAMTNELIPIQSYIHEFRGQKVMLDFDLAKLYQVETKALNQAVKRNIERFPADFMFRLAAEEVLNMRSQIVTASKRNASAAPFAFTEQGVAMLASVLKSPIAVAVSISIMRAFVQVRQ